MIKKCIFIDVFTNSPYTGNPLAVFPESDNLNSFQMQLLANEINYSETTFISKNTSNDADFDIRIFTPKQEIPFAGHPAIGTAFTIAKVLKVWSGSGNTIKLKTKVGIIPLEFMENTIWMEQNKPEFLKSYDNKQLIAELVGLNAEDVSDDLPIEEVTTGNKILILPVKKLSSIQRAFGNSDKLESFFKQSGCLAPYLFSRETLEAKNHIHSRFFAPHLGIIEDPATGSAAGPLIGYLLKYDVFGDKFEIINEQGYEIKRPSLIFMRGKRVGNNFSVNIGGECAYIGNGEFDI